MPGCGCWCQSWGGLSPVYTKRSCQRSFASCRRHSAQTPWAWVWWPLATSRSLLVSSPLVCGCFVLLCGTYAGVSGFSVSTARENPSIQLKKKKKAVISEHFQLQTRKTFQIAPKRIIRAFSAPGLNFQELGANFQRFNKLIFNLAEACLGIVSSQA